MLTCFISSGFVLMSEAKLALGAVNIAADARVANGSINHKYNKIQP